MNINSNAGLQSFDTQKIVEFLGEEYRMQDFYNIRTILPSFNINITQVELDEVFNVEGFNTLQNRPYLIDPSGVNMTISMFTYGFYGCLFLIRDDASGTITIDTPATATQYFQGTFNLMTAGVWDTSAFYLETLSGPINSWRVYIVPSGSTIVAAGGSFNYQSLAAQTSAQYLIWSNDIAADLTSSGNLVLIGPYRYATIQNSGTIGGDSYPVNTALWIDGRLSMIGPYLTDAGSYSKESVFYNIAFINVTYSATNGVNDDEFTQGFCEQGKLLVPKYALSNNAQSIININVL